MPYPPSVTPVPKREPVAPSAAAVVAAAPAGNTFPRLIAFVFWLGGVALIAWGAYQLAYFFGFNPRNGLDENGNVAAATANRLAEIKALIRELVGGVFIAGGLLAATLGTMLARPPRN